MDHMANRIHDKNSINIKILLKPLVKITLPLIRDYSFDSDYFNPQLIFENFNMYIIILILTYINVKNKEK